VLGVLALHANRVVPTQRLLESVWGPTPPKTATKAEELPQERVSAFRNSDGKTDSELRV